MHVGNRMKCFLLIVELRISVSHIVLLEHALQNDRTAPIYGTAWAVNKSVKHII